jgi:hypothetical protein
LAHVQHPEAEIGQGLIGTSFDDENVRTMAAVKQYADAHFGGDR